MCRVCVCVCVWCSCRGPPCCCPPQCCCGGGREGAVAGEAHSSPGQARAAAREASRPAATSHVGGCASVQLATEHTVQALVGVHVACGGGRRRLLEGGGQKSWPAPPDLHQQKPTPCSYSGAHPHHTTKHTQGHSPHPTPPHPTPPHPTPPPKPPRHPPEKMKSTPCSYSSASMLSRISSPSPCAASQRAAKSCVQKHHQGDAAMASGQQAAGGQQPSAARGAAPGAACLA